MQLKSQERTERKIFGGPMTEQHSNLIRNTVSTPESKKLSEFQAERTQAKQHWGILWSNY